MSTPRLSRTAACTASLLLLAGCGGGGSDGTDELEVTGTVMAKGVADAQTASLDMTDDLTFQPNQVTAQVGTLALTAKNVGRVPHNLVFQDAAMGTTPTVKGSGTATLTVPLKKAGTYRFTCTFHPGMDGQVVVSG
jgi:plastocyanin